MNVLLPGRRAGFTAALMLLLALFVAAPLAAKPIPLTQPLDFQGKRVLVVPLLDKTVGAYSLNRMAFGRYQREQGDSGNGIDIDALAAREVQGKLKAFGVDAEILAVDYADADICGDQVSLSDDQMPHQRAVDQIVRGLFAEHRPDAVLVLARWGVFMGKYRQPAIGYGVIATQGGWAGAYSSMTQMPYVQGRKKALVVRTANAIQSLEGVAAEEDPSFPPPETWAKVRPALEDLTGRLARSLAAETYDRALRPPPTATPVWRSNYPREELLNPLSPR